MEGSSEVTEDDDDEHQEQDRGRSTEGRKGSPTTASNPLIIQYQNKQSIAVAGVNVRQDISGSGSGSEGSARWTGKYDRAPGCEYANMRVEGRGYGIYASEAEQEALERSGG